MTKTWRAWRLALWTGTAVAILLAVGFLFFAQAATRPARLPQQKADGIVALTGTQQRLVVAARLLAEGHGRRLLVTGVNRQTTGEELRRLTGLDLAAFDCCVDLGYQALDTIGNAKEAREWVESHGFAAVIVVTSGYHMPRSLIELRRTMPRVRLIPYPVPSRYLDGRAWWTSPGAVRVLASEYVKFLPSAARFALDRILRLIDTKAVAYVTTAREQRSPTWF